MAKPFIGGNQEIYARLRQSFEAAKIDQAQIDKILSSKVSLDAILADQPNLAQYFRNAAAAFQALVDSDFDRKATRASVLPPENFKEFYGPERDTSKGQLWVERMDPKYFSNPQYLVTEGIMTPQQVESLKKAMSQGCFAEMQAQSGKVSWDDDQAGEGHGKAYGSGHSKAYGSGSDSHAKAYGSGKSYGTGAPPPPPPPPPPPSGGSYPGGSTNPSGGQYTQAERDYVINNVQDTPVYGLFPPLLDREEKARGIVMSTFDRMHQRQELRNQIMMDINNLDLTTPEGQRQFYILKQKSEELGQGDKEDYDMMVRVNQLQNEFVNLVKTIMEIQYKTLERAVSNIGPK